ncbi:MAG: BolA family transcriptional regulator [Gammaproteobacteria bacterium]|nr:MAG: BolA family transcriptional regulator [Gammaproteobacteria bacterium]
MTADEVKALIESGLPDAKVAVTGGEGKFEAEVISELFEGLSMIKQHQMVYATVNDHIISGELHALSLKTSVHQI